MALKYTGTRMLGIAGGIKAYITIGTRTGIAGGIKAYITIGTRVRYSWWH